MPMVLCQPLHGESPCPTSHPLPCRTGQVMRSGVGRYCWVSFWDRSPRGKRLVRNVAQRPGGAWSPPALKPSSVAVSGAHLGWGCAALGLKGHSSHLLQIRKANNLHSGTSEKAGIAQRRFPGFSALPQQQSPCVCLQTSGLLPWSLCWHVIWAMSTSDWNTGGSRECQAPPWAAGVPSPVQQLGKPCRETTAHLSQELVAVGRVLREKLLAKGWSVKAVWVGGGKQRGGTHSAFR